MQFCVIVDGVPYYYGDYLECQVVAGDIETREGIEPMTRVMVVGSWEV